jgi:hypothetical protein
MNAIDMSFAASIAGLLAYPFKGGTERERQAYANGVKEAAMAYADMRANGNKAFSEADFYGRCGMEALAIACKLGEI